MSEIQQARDLLAKWRQGVTPGQWQVNLIWSMGIVWDDAVLTAGTAGNPELLDAIDGFLSVAAASKGTKAFAAGFVVDAERIAAAIIAGDERMSA